MRINMLEELKKKVYEANMDLQQHKLVTFTWGNVSGIDREKGLFVIKPSGVEYEKLSPEMMVVMDLKGNKIEGDYNPSSDTKTHLVLYNAFKKIGGIVHTHSPWATSWAQAGRSIPCYGTTHADYFYGAVPCVRTLTQKEIDEDYEYNTGVLIAEHFTQIATAEKQKGESIEPYIAMPCVLCKNHGPFAWGTSPEQAVYHAVVLEEIAKMAARAEALNNHIEPAPQILQDKHYLRKHGANAYYGQSKKI
ncbi:MAG: L-ribulose-5-phosphate 4-epimerase [Treponema phagedenis]